MIHAPTPAQARAYNAQEKEIFFRSHPKTGRSYMLRMLAILWASENPGLAVYIISPSYEDARRNHFDPPDNIHSLARAFSKTTEPFHAIEKTGIRLFNRSTIRFIHPHRGDIHTFQGMEFNAALIDGVNKFTPQQYEFLRYRCRDMNRSPAFPRIVAAECKKEPTWTNYVWGANLMKSDLPRLLLDDPTHAYAFK